MSEERKKKKRKVLILLCSVCIGIFLLSFMFASSRSGFMPKNIFKQDQIVYRTKEGNFLYGFHTIESQTYYFDEETGVMQTGFADIDDNTYYFKKDGTMVKGFYRIEDDYYYFYEDGKQVKNQFKKISINEKNQISYFDEDGKMVTNQYKGKIFNEYGELLIDEDTLFMQAQTIINKYEGNVGLYFKDLRTQQEISINDNTFYPCSIIKVCVLVTVYNYIDQGLLEYDSCQTYLENMIIHSDNTSYNALITMLGNGDGIKGLQIVNTYMMQLGLQNTQLHHSLSPGDIYFSDSDTNISCPSDIGLLFDLLYQGEIISQDACDQMLDLLKQCADRRAIRQGLPDAIQFAHKSGWAYDLYLDGGIVYIPDKDYILVLFTDQISNKTDFFKEMSNLFYTYEINLFTLE